MFYFCIFHFYFEKFAMGLQGKWVSSSTSLLKVCMALGSEVVRKFAEKEECE